MLTRPKATGGGTVSIVLLQGPSTNVVPIGCLVDNLPNTGKFVWTPSTSLIPDTTHYGLQIITDGTGAYQYSDQFGISNSGMTSSAPTLVPISQTSIAPVSIHKATPTITYTQYSSHVSSTHSHKSTKYAISASSYVASSGFASNSANASQTHHRNSTSIKLPTVIASTGFASTGFPLNSGYIQPTIPLSVPSKLPTALTPPTIATAPTTAATGVATGAPTTPKTSTPATATGAAGTVIAGGMLAGLGAVAALVL